MGCQGSSSGEEQILIPEMTINPKACLFTELSRATSLFLVNRFGGRDKNVTENKESFEGGLGVHASHPLAPARSAVLVKISIALTNITKNNLGRKWLISSVSLRPHPVTEGS